MSNIIPTTPQAKLKKAYALMTEAKNLLDYVREVVEEEQAAEDNERRAERLDDIVNALFDVSSDLEDHLEPKIILPELYSA